MARAYFRGPSTAGLAEEVELSESDRGDIGAFTKGLPDVDTAFLLGQLFPVEVVGAIVEAVVEYDKRLGETSDITDVVRFLASEEARWATGRSSKQVAVIGYERLDDALSCKASGIDALIVVESRITRIDVREYVFYVCARGTYHRRWLHYVLSGKQLDLNLSAVGYSVPPSPVGSGPRGGQPSRAGVLVPWRVGCPPWCG